MPDSSGKANDTPAPPAVLKEFCFLLRSMIPRVPSIGARKKSLVKELRAFDDSDDGIPRASSDPTLGKTPVLRPRQRPVVSPLHPNVVGHRLFRATNLASQILVLIQRLGRKKVV